jgi:hypothetical protein
MIKKPLIKNKMTGWKKHLIPLCLLCLLGCVRLPAQKMKDRLREVSIPQYAFINYDCNLIRIPGGDSTRINYFFHKIDTLIMEGKGRINILHIGGSHVQADMFSHQVRRNLDAINAKFRSPRGFIFPFAVAKTNNPSNYTVTYSGEWNAARNVQRERTIPLGMGGIAVYTRDPHARINISLNTNEDLRWDFSRLRLLGYTIDNTETVRPVLYYNNDTIEGKLDLITHTYIFEMPQPDYAFSIGFIQEETTPHTFVVNGFIPEKDTPGIVYHAIGVNGAAVPSYLGSEHFEDELPLLNPDLIIFAIGINDANSSNFSEETFYQNYNKLIEKIERVSPDCAFIFITNNDSYKKISKKKSEVNMNGLIARDVFYRLSKEYQGGVWDLFEIMGGLYSVKEWQKALLAAPDKVHFTRTGYVLIGDMFYNALINYYKQMK